MGIADRKAREFQRREKEIIEAAFDLFLKKGLDAVTIEMIADTAEVGKGTVYKHFKSKHEIFAHILLDLGDAIIEKMESIDRNLPILEQIRSLLDIYLDAVLTDPGAFQLYRKCEHVLTPEFLSREVLDKIAQHHDRKAGFIEILFEQAVNEGVFIDAPASTLSLIASGALFGTLEQCLQNPRIDTHRVMRDLQNVLIRGMIS